jgi:hypothetical protein
MTAPQRSALTTTTTVFFHGFGIVYLDGKYISLFVRLHLTYCVSLDTQARHHPF